MDDEGKASNLKESIAYQEGSTVSRILLKTEKNNITLFAFDKGQSLSEHTVPFDAFVQILDGEALITVGGKENTVKNGDYIVMPANIPHEVKASEKFKMLLTMLRT